MREIPCCRQKPGKNSLRGWWKFPAQARKIRQSLNDVKGLLELQPKKIPARREFDQQPEAIRAE
ncbi:MAG: hypothetical protein WA459_14870 [Stellaceae bacterium]